ncbi:MAG: hypothetical protein EOM87_06340 [Clostridia bacterium]|nr:hypothetical protein [Clostridia bacterium]
MEEKNNLPYEKAIESMAREYKKVMAKPIQAFPYMGENRVFYTCKKLLSNAKLNETAIKPLFNHYNIYSELNAYAKLVFDRTNRPDVREIVLSYIKMNNKILDIIAKLYTKLTNKPISSNAKINLRLNYGDTIRKMLLLSNRAQVAYLEYTDTVCGMRTALALLPRYSYSARFALLSLLGF